MPRKFLLIAPLLATGFLGLQGCSDDDHDYHHRHEGPPPARVVEVAPYGYAYGPEYYDHGYYQDNYWYWKDRGRWYREAREDHERRMRDYHDHDHYDHDHR